MSPAEILKVASAAGLSLRGEAGKIVARPRNAMTDELRTLIRDNKTALLALLEHPVADVAHVAVPMGGQPRTDYTTADMQEMDKLLRQLAQLEGWTDEKLAEKLDERRRMAPANVPGALQQLRAATAAALAPWPEKPAKRAAVVLCVIAGGKDKRPRQQHEPTEPEAA